MFNEIINMWLYLNLSLWGIGMALGSVVLIGSFTYYVWKKHENITISDIVKPVLCVFVYAYIVKIVGVLTLFGLEQINFVNMYNVYSSIGSIVLHTMLVILIGWMLYRVYHQYFMQQTKKLETAYVLAKTLAIITTPYMFLISAGWFF